MVDERIRVRDVGRVGPRDRRKRHAVETRDKLDLVTGAKNLADKRVECRVGCRIQRRYRVPHFADTPPQRIDAEDALPLMQRERTLELPCRRRREMRQHRRHQPSLDPVVAQQPAHVLLDRVADARGLSVGRDAGELGNGDGAGGRHGGLL
jgi:hypothetical protein